MGEEMILGYLAAWIVLTAVSTQIYYVMDT